MEENSSVLSCGANWLALCFAFALGEACGFAASHYAALWPVAALAAPVVALGLVASGVRGVRFAVAFALGLVLSLAAAHARNEALADATVRACGTPFARTFAVEGDARVRVGRDGVRWAAVPARTCALRVRVILPLADGDEPPARGESWECAGWLERTAHDDPSRRRVLWVKGRGTYARRIGRGAFASRLAALRADLSRRMGVGLDDPDEADLARAILLGERTRLTGDERNAFVAAGTIHVFAISGLHVMLVAEALALALALVGCPLRGRGVVLVPVLWLYVALTGGSPSAVRAAAMASLKFLAPLFWRRADGLVAWSLTFLVVYARDPLMFFDVGCALSFAVMLGLVFWGRFAHEFVPNRVASALVMTFAAWAVGTPIAAHAFGRFTPGGLLANLALLPAAGVGVKASIAGVLASFVSDRLAAYANNFAALVTRTMSGLSRLVAALPGANVSVEPWPLAACVGWYVALALLLWLLRSVLTRRRRQL